MKRLDCNSGLAAVGWALEGSEDRLIKSISILVSRAHPNVVVVVRRAALKAGAGADHRPECVV